MLECVSRWNQTMPAAISIFVKHAPPVKKAASLIAEGDVDVEKEEDPSRCTPPIF